MASNGTDFYSLSLDAGSESNESSRARSESHPDQADRLVSPKLVKKRPGMVYTKGEIVLHTNLAHRMFYGRSRTKVNGKTKHQIVGLVRFISNVNQICDLARAGDPYADYWLLELEQMMDDTRVTLSETKQYLRELLDTGGASSRVSVKTGISESPVTLPLEFKYKTYGFQAADLVGLFDEVVQLALNAKDAAWLLPAEFKQLVNHAGRSLRHTFLTSAKYKYSGAKRNDFAANNQRARLAVERMGFELPEDVLTGRKQPKWMPQHDVIWPEESGSASETEAVSEKTECADTGKDSDGQKG